MKRHRSWRRRALWSVGIAVGFVSAWWFSGGVVRSILDDALGAVFFPAFAVAIMLSRNPHRMNVPVYIAALLAESTLLALLTWFLVDVAKRAMRRGLLRDESSRGER